MIVGIGSSGAGIHNTGEQQFLVLRFDEKDLLQGRRIEVADPNFKDCTADWICHDGEGRVIRLAGPAREAEAKSCTPDEQHCNVYLIGASLSHIGRNDHVVLDDRHMGATFLVDSFFNWQLTPGTHRIGIQPLGKEIALDCKARQSLFVKFEPAFWSQESAQLMLLDVQAGREWVQREQSKLVRPMSWPGQPGMTLND